MESEEGRIITLITDFLTPQFNKKSFLLKFTYNEKEYTTQFEAKHTDNELEIKNPCVNMLFEYKNPNGVSAFVGGIESNSKEKKCFSPMLVTNARTDAKNKVGKRTTAADVLQILKSKLALAFPVNAPVTLNDGAQKDGIMMIQQYLLIFQKV